ncbi:hypothetical protein [Xenophilus azovorans]|uniref:hypothetical protein n=1 Tax=Xenophilus azovorans TaxID=151755 RepID=UPI0012ED7CD0|nr:hypothetical protein [Xenophilus azovorans]
MSGLRFVSGGGSRGPYRAPPGASFIRCLRVGLKLTQPEAASRAGVGLRTFQRAESGDVVDRATRRRIERAMGSPW